MDFNYCSNIQLARRWELNATKPRMLDVCFRKGGYVYVTKYCIAAQNGVEEYQILLCGYKFKLKTSAHMTTRASIRNVVGKSYSIISSLMLSCMPIPYVVQV